MEISQTPITPVEQSTITIAGYEIIVVLLPGGQAAAALRMFCDMLRLNYGSQLRKIRAHHVIKDRLFAAYIETSGGKQEANVILAEAIPIWLAEIHETKVSPDAHEILRICQLDAARTIRQKFFSEVRIEPGQTLPTKEESEQSVPLKQGPAQTLPPKEAPAQTLPPKEEPKQAVPPQQEPEPAHLSAEADEVPYWQELYGGLIGLEQHTRTLVAFQQRTEARMGRINQYLNEDATALKRHEAILRQHETWMAQFAEQLKALTALVNSLLVPGSLTAEHQGKLRARIQAAAHQAGQPASVIERELAAALGVSTLSQLTESAWGQIAAWFQARLGW